MEWFSNRHAYYICSEDFMSMLTLLHLCCMICTGYGLRRHSTNAGELRVNIWALALASILFIVCLGFSNVPKDRSGGRKFTSLDNFFKWFLPFIIACSLVSFITLSIYHGTILFFALHLLLLAFALTGIPCIILFVVCFASVGLGMGCHVILLAYMFSDRQRLPKSLIRKGLGISIRHGALRNGKIILMDMLILGIQIVGGLIIHSRLSKLGHFLSVWKHKPSRFLGTFDSLRHLESITLQRCFDNGGIGTFTTLTSSNTNLTKLTQPSHHALESINSSSNFETFSISNPTNIDFDDEEDKVWSDFSMEHLNIQKPSQCNTERIFPCTTGLQTMGSSTFYLSREHFINSVMNFDKHPTRSGGDSIADSLPLMSQRTRNTTLRHNVQSNTGHLLAPLGTRDLRSTKGPDSIMDHMYSRLSFGEVAAYSSIYGSVTSQQDMKLSPTRAEDLSKHGSSLHSTELSRPEDTISSFELQIAPIKTSDSADKSSFTSFRSDDSLPGGFNRLGHDGEKFVHLDTTILNPIILGIYRMLPRCCRRCFTRIFSWLECLGEKRVVMNMNNWTGPLILPPMNKLGLFANTKIEGWYVEWMHNFNFHFQVSTVYETLWFCIYVAVLGGASSFRHYLTLNPNDAGRFLSTSRIIIMVLKFGACPLLTVFALFPLSRGKKRSAQYLYKLMLCLCLINWILELCDICTFPCTKYPGYVLQGPIAILTLMSMSGVYLCTRIPTFLALYFLFFISLFVIKLVYMKKLATMFLVMDSIAQITVGIGTMCFIAVPLDGNRRRLFSSFTLPYISYLEHMGISSIQKSFVGPGVDCVLSSPLCSVPPKEAIIPPVTPTLTP
ncbi:hypothetical protein BdWA1_001034 [Babesia duncani]|uniref:Uncharacterized protein n=1 Tax=Babesia duncani TaxID=323732 RepID=A0AAD9PN96_9APIC|nr:hypothetical protein BdWA1_001034 [Babesia duncani]